PSSSPSRRPARSGSPPSSAWPGPDSVPAERPLARRGPIPGTPGAAPGPRAKTPEAGCAGHQEKDERGRPEGQREAGREPRRYVAPGDNAASRRNVDGLDETGPADGQRGGRAAPGMPGGAPAR